MCEPNVPELICKYCKLPFPATGQFFRQDKMKPNGLRGECKSCYRKLKKQWYEEHKVEQNAKQREAYARDPNRKLTTNRRFFANHPGYKQASDQAYYHRNSENIKSRVKAYRRSHPEVNQASRKRCYLENPELTWARNERRRAKKLSLPYDWTGGDICRMHFYWQHRCCVCGRTEGLWHRLVHDHWIAVNDPRADNPGTVVWNMLPMCQSKKGSNGLNDCNRAKSDSDPIEWLTKTLGEKGGREKLAEIERYFAWARSER